MPRYISATFPDALLTGRSRTHLRAKCGDMRLAVKVPLDAAHAAGERTKMRSAEPTPWPPRLVEASPGFERTS